MNLPAALYAWKTDHARLWALLQMAERQAQASSLHSRLASLLESHAVREEHAFLALEPNPLLEHLSAEHRALEPVLARIESGRHVFTMKELEFLAHHFKEEEGWVQANVASLWAYRPLQDDPIFRFLPSEFL